MALNTAYVLKVQHTFMKSFSSEPPVRGAVMATPTTLLHQVQVTFGRGH